MKENNLTKAQIKRLAQLERRGYDYSYTSERGNPVLVDRLTKIWVEVFPSGRYQP